MPVNLCQTTFVLKCWTINMHGNLYTPEMISICKIAVSQQENKKEIVSSII